MASVLVTGGAGFLGSHVVRRLLDLGHEVCVLDAFLHYPRRPLDRFHARNLRYREERLLSGAVVERCDIRESEDLRRRVNAFRPDCLIHAAALPLADLAIEHSGEAFGSIVTGTFHLLEIVRDLKHTPRLVFISSSMVYGDFETTPIPETARTQPKEIYGGMKLAAEQLVKVYAQRYGIDYTIVRPSAVYGPTDNNGRVLAKFLSQAILGEKLVVRNAETTCLDFSYVEDVACGICQAAFSPEGVNQVFNITRGEGRLLKDALMLIRRMYRGVEVELQPGTTFHPRRGALDVSKARRLLGYEPQVDIEEGLHRYAQFLEETAIEQGSVEPTVRLKLAA